MKTFWHLTVGATIFMGCTHNIRNHQFESSSPLFGKRIGVYYDRKIIGDFEGLDEHDSREYLTALVTALERYSGNVTFLDRTHAGAKIPGYKPFPVKRVGWLGDTTIVEYRVPEPGSLKDLEDSLDYVMLLQNLTRIVDVPVVEHEEKFSIAGFHTLPGKLPGSEHLILPAFPTMRVVETEKQEVHHLGYILWDFKREALIGYDRNSLSKQDFMDRGTTFAQDAEITSQRVLREMLKVSVP